MCGGRTWGDGRNRKGNLEREDRQNIASFLSYTESKFHRINTHTCMFVYEVKAVGKEGTSGDRERELERRVKARQ